MLSYCLKCRKNTQSINPGTAKTGNGGTIYYESVLYVTLKNQDL